MTLFHVISVVIGVVALSGYLNYKLIKLPDTIGITAIGLLLSLLLVIASAYVPALAEWARTASAAIDFPQIVFEGMLGLLLFAGSLHVSFTDLAEAKRAILVLATVGVAISIVVVGFGFHYGAQLIGLDIPLIWCFVFGALISPTDPIAALAVLRKAGVPRSLEIKITGESLFNDGVGVVLFITLLGFATGEHNAAPLNIGLLLLWEIAGAILFGLAFGYAAFVLLRGVDSYVVETLITLAVPTSGYALAETLHVSAPIAVVVMGLVIGNHGRRYAMTEQTRQRLFQFWELTDELLNLLLFGIIGFELMVLAGSTKEFFGVALLAVPVVLVARYVSVSLPMIVIRRFRRFESHTVKIMTWAGLRGGISVALALSLPQSRVKEMIVAATYVVALFSILVQATTVEKLARKWAAAAESGD